MKKLIISAFAVVIMLVFSGASVYAVDFTDLETGNCMSVVGTVHYATGKGEVDSASALAAIAAELMGTDHSLDYVDSYDTDDSSVYVFMPNYIVNIKYNSTYGCYGIFLQNNQYSGWLHAGSRTSGRYMLHCPVDKYEPDLLNNILTALIGTNNGTGGIRKYVDEIATVSWRIDSSLSDLSDTLTSVISNGKVLVDNSDIVSAIQSIPAFDDTNIVDAINSIPAFDASGIITTIQNTSDTVVTKLTSLLTTSDKILGSVNSGNSTLLSIDTKLSSISGQLTKIVNALNNGSSSGGTTVSVSASAISDPIVSAVDVLRVSLTRQLSDTWYTGTAMDEYTVPAYGTCYIPFAVGDYPDDGSWSSYSSDLYVIPGDVEISPDIIDSNFIPSDYGFGEEGLGWFTSSSFSAREIFTNDYFNGVTVVNTSASDILLYVSSPDEDFTASLYTLGQTISGKLTLILNRIPTSGGSDLTGVTTRLDTIIEELQSSSGEFSCDHTYAQEMTQAPTCILPGLQVSTCSKCGSSYSEIVAALGHDWQCTDHVEDVTDPDTGEVTETGYDIYTCSRCSDTYNDYSGSGAPSDYGDTSISKIIVSLFSKLGTFAGKILSWIIGLFDKLLGGLDDLITRFSELTAQITGFGGDYPTWLSGFWGILPQELQLALGFSFVCLFVGLIGRKLFFA